ncbi:MAG: peptidoglycan DD-metalloendopeptidase family protein [Sideroxydans sp.]|nr:peptidoglycan DD-metalloendopeptidase family protein [Sideroxydans sp.]
MKRIVRLVLLSLCLAAASGAAHASQQEELDNLRKRIGALQQELEKTSESKSEAADALRESERAISESNRKLNNLSQQQHQATRTLEQMQQKSALLEKDVQSQQALLGELLYQQYLGGRQEYLKLLLNNHDPNQTARELQYYEYIARGRAAWLNTLRANLAQINSLTDQTKQKSEEIAALQNEEQVQKKHLEDDKRAHRQVLNKIATQLKQQRREMDRLQRNENRLSQLVEKLSRILAQPQGSGVFSNSKLPDDRFDGKPFASLKGKLTLPVRGEVTNRFGTPHPDSRVLWKGLFLRAASGQAVKAVAAGRVVFADWLRGFGNLLIIDHGKGYMSLYGNNETLYKQVGDTLRGGDTVAAVGNSGGNENSGLYFELRYEGKPLDPMQWVAAK